MYVNVYNTDIISLEQYRYIDLKKKEKGTTGGLEPSREASAPSIWCNMSIKRVESRGGAGVAAVDEGWQNGLDDMSQ